MTEYKPNYDYDKGQDSLEKEVNSLPVDKLRFLLHSVKESLVSTNKRNKEYYLSEINELLKKPELRELIEIEIPKMKNPITDKFQGNKRERDFESSASNNDKKRLNSQNDSNFNQYKKKHSNSEVDYQNNNQSTPIVRNNEYLYDNNQQNINKIRGGLTNLTDLKTNTIKNLSQNVSDKARSSNINIVKQNTYKNDLIDLKSESPIISVKQLNQMNEINKSISRHSSIRSINDQVRKSPNTENLSEPNRRNHIIDLIKETKIDEEKNEGVKHKGKLITFGSKFISFLYTNGLKIILGCLFLGVVWYFSTNIQDVNFLKPKEFWINGVIGFLALLGVGLFLKLLKMYYEERSSKNKLIAENCANGIIEELKKNSSLEEDCTPEIKVKDFISEYCKVNKCKENYFMKTIFPLMKESLDKSEEVEQRGVFNDGVLYLSWVLKN